MKLRLWETDEIIKRQIVRVKSGKPFTKDGFTGAPKGSVQYLKEFVIKPQIQKINRLKYNYNVIKKKMEALKAKHREDLKKQNYNLWVKRKKAYAVTNKKLNDKAQELYYDKIKVQRKERSTYLDGVVALPLLLKFSEENNMHISQLSIFIIIACHQWFSVKDGTHYGFKPTQCGYHAKQMVKKGLLDSFRVGTANRYVLSVNGEKLFRSYMFYYTTKTNELFNQIDKKMNKRFGGTRFYYYYERKKRYADQQQNKIE